MNDMTVDMDKTAIGTMDISEKTQVVLQPGAEATQYAANVDCPVCKTPNPPSETYCMDCGFELQSQPVAVEASPQEAPVGVLVSSDGIREFPLKAGENTVGRQDADVLLTHNTVSRNHAKVIVEGASVFVEDIGSTNGTTVDGQRLAANVRTEIKDGAEVVFGSMGLSFKAAAVPSEPEQTVFVEAADEESQSPEPPDDLGCADSDTAEAPEPEPEASVESEPAVEQDTLVEAEVVPEPEPEPQGPAIVGRFLSKDGIQAFDIKEGVNTIGRRIGENDMVVPDPYCSGRHAELSAESGVFTLTDVGSTNGTLLNGVRMEPNAPRVVQESDEITIGRIVFKIEVA